MRFYIPISHNKKSGIYTNDKNIFSYLIKNKFFIWYIVFKDGKLDGIAFLTKYKSFMKEVKEVVSKWKKKNLKCVKNVQ